MCLTWGSKLFHFKKSRAAGGTFLLHNHFLITLLYSWLVLFHIKNCNYYQNELKKQYGMAPTSTEKRNFHLSLYEPIVTNATNYNKRKRLEAISIVIFDP